MAYILHDAHDWYLNLMDNKSDPRVNDWFLLSSPLPTLAMCLFYAYFSKFLGPRLMSKRPAMNLRNLLIYYNLIQTLFSAWIFYEYLMSGWWADYSLKCQPVDYSRNPKALRMARICWWYYISKFTEFFDTLFFILRKKNEHVSTLHVIHHGCMPFSVWMGLKFAPGGHSTFFALLNSFVHIVMYFYYMIAAMGPKYQKYIWWKKYLTTFQMLQFVAIFTHQFQLLFRECNYPKSFMVWIGLHGVMFLFLFSDFYKTKYTKAKAKSIAAASKLAAAAAASTSEQLKGAGANGVIAYGNGVGVGVAVGVGAKFTTANNNANNSGVAVLTKISNGGGNRGACMPIIEDDECERSIIALSKGQKEEEEKEKDEEEAEAEAVVYIKEGAVSVNQAITTPDSSSSSLHQRKVK